ncbi:hypothetical protein ACSBR1_006031 [Camellia fascicularis]
MYSTDYQNYAAPSAPPLPPYSEPALGIPISSSTNHFYGQGPQLPVPSPVQPIPQQVPWSTGLCDCYNDVPNCCITCWCPCITFGQIAEIVDKGSTSCGASGALYAVIAIVTGCPFFYSCLYRSKMRQQYLLHESPCCCRNCLVHCCCEPCALCQEYRELKNRGFDLSLANFLPIYIY